MGVDVPKTTETGLANKSLIGKISCRISKVLDWLAKGQAGNPPCNG
jgi:hypothetical protein